MTVDLGPEIQIPWWENNGPRPVKEIATPGTPCLSPSGAANQIGTPSDGRVECKVNGSLVTLKNGYCTAECIYHE